MTYTLKVHVPEAEPYAGLSDYDEVREAVEQECANTVNELGSDILDEGTEAEREMVVEHLADAAMMNLWRQPRHGEANTKHRLPGPRNSLYGGVLLTLEREKVIA